MLPIFWATLCQVPSSQTWHEVKVVQFLQVCTVFYTNASKEYKEGQLSLILRALRAIADGISVIVPKVVRLI